MDESASKRLQRIIDKKTARRAVEAIIEGTALKFRELKAELVIMNPSDPEQGRIRIEYSNGYVTYERVVWEHWGVLQEYESEDKDDERYVTADRIIATLTGDKDD
jgi:hypothetical protein